jgi:GAF domain-containing protein
VKAQPDQQSNANVTVQSLLIELERCRSALAESRGRAAELDQGEALLAGENRVLEMVAKGESLPSTLDGICRLVEENSSGSLCSILLLDTNCDRLRHGAAPSLPTSYFGAFDGRAIGPTTGPCGRACFFKKPFMVCDIALDPLGDDYRDLALAHGLRACWSTPIFSSEGKVLGSFAVLSREPRNPTPQQQKLISQCTRLAWVGMEG